jgi:hypothetical protein
MEAQPVAWLRPLLRRGAVAVLLMIIAVLLWQCYGAWWLEQAHVE